MTRPILSLALVLLAAPCWADIHDFNAVNLRRVNNGLPPFTYSSELTALAESKAQEMARTDPRKNQCHFGQMYGGTWEGIGYQSGSDPYGRDFHSCYHFPKSRGPGIAPTWTAGGMAGAAAASNGQSTYYVIEISKGTSLSAMKTGSRSQITKRVGLLRRVFRRR